MSIIQLDKKTIEQIAAGEVIESPVSIVKELVENSVDARADRIVVEIKNGGKSYIRVTDNGIGIAEEDLELAFKRHATSKIKEFTDLYSLYTLGFRGEALSSIVSCADVKLVSKQKDSKIGKKIIYSDGKIKEKSSIATNIGTSIEVYDLFKNMPVRRKFLGSDINESNKISRLLYALALGNTNISIKFIKDGRLIFNTNEYDKLEDKIIKLVDDSLKNNLISIDLNNDLYQIRGYISNENYYRGNRSLQYLFVNNRLVDDTKISGIIEKHYKSLIPSNRFPAFFIFIKTDSKNIDVNIHPNKKEIKFSYESDLFYLLDSIGSLLYENSKIKTINNKEKEKKEIKFYDDYSEILNAYNIISNKVSEDKEEYGEKTYNTNSDFFEEKNLSFFDIDKDINSNLKQKESNKIEKKENDDEINFDKLIYKCSLFKSYSLFEYKDSLYILNHRRCEQNIKFNKYIDQFNNDMISSQELLEPIVLKININDYDKYLNKKDIIEKLGFKIEEFSYDKLLIRAVPIIFENPENLDIFYDLLDLDIDSKKVFYKKIFNIISSFSFRKGDVINKDEARKILKDLEKCENPYKTYDGKSTIILIEKSELEKYFDR